MTRRFFFGLIPAVLAIVAHPIDSFARFVHKSRRYRSFVVSNSYGKVLQFVGTNPTFSVNKLELIGKSFRIERCSAQRKDDKTFELTIDFVPIPEYLHTVDFDKDGRFMIPQEFQPAVERMLQDGV